MDKNKRYCVLLTATIEPKGMSFTRRTDPKVREADYITAIENLSRRIKYPLIFAENSGYDTKRVKQVLERCAGGRYEIIQTTEGQNFPSELGKGYGEFVLMLQALKRSASIQRSRYIIKITGRYTIMNLNEILESLGKEGEFMVAADYTLGQRYAMSYIFICKPEFITSYMKPLHDMMNDSKQKPFELILRMAIENAIKDGHIFVKFAVKPMVEGYSGTWNAKFKGGDFNKFHLSWGKVLIECRKLRQRFSRRWVMVCRWWCK